MPQLHFPLAPEHRLVRWANMIRAFYGHPIWLVGSQLGPGIGRDVDVVCVLPDPVFALRYDLPAPVWKQELQSGVVGEEFWAWSDDVVKKSEHGMRYTRLPIDFKTQPVSYARQLYSRHLRLQLDTRRIENEINLYLGPETTLA